MKVGILTFHAAHNYGAMLQAYATQHAVRQLGHDANVIDYHPPSAARNNRVYKWKDSPRHWLKNGALALHHNEWSRRYNRFETFKSEELRLSRHYASLQAITAAPPEFDAYIAGSDQVWNSERGISPVWLLHFVREGRKIAYGPSFGSETVPAAQEAVFQRYLPTFDALSCREEQGCALIRDMTGLQAEQVVDPTLLLTIDKWNAVASPAEIAQPYLLVYCMEFTPAFRMLVDKIARALGLYVVSIAGGAINRLGAVDRVIRDAGPGEFVALFKNASFVCTNSFHGTAFSINFSKNFVALPHSTRNSRLSSLLALTSLQHRQLTRPDEVDAWSAEQWLIDYSTVLPLLRDKVDQSKYFLQEALS